MQKSVYKTEQNWTDTDFLEMKINDNKNNNYMCMKIARTNCQ